MKNLDLQPGIWPTSTGESNKIMWNKGNSVFKLNHRAISHKISTVQSSTSLENSPQGVCISFPNVKARKLDTQQERQVKTESESLHKYTSNSTVQDKVMLIWGKQLQVLSLEVLHVNSSHCKQQQGYRWQPASQTLHPSLSWAVKPTGFSY